MAIWLAAALLGVPDGEPPDLLQDGQEIDFFLRFRTGVWGSRDFDFETVRADGVPRRAKGEWITSTGFDAGAVFPDQWALILTYEFEASHEYFGHVAGASLGYRGVAQGKVDPGVPEETLLYAGVLWGTLEVHDDSFGDFDESVGFRAGLSLTWRLHPTLVVTALGEYRLMEFDYREPILEGDDKTGGSGIMVGVGLDVRF